MTNTIALQLYTVRDETAKNFIGTLRAVADIGYHGVEFAGYGDLDAKKLAGILSEYGMKTVGSHVGLALLEKDIDREIAYCLEIGSPYLIVPSIDKIFSCKQSHLKNSLICSITMVSVARLVA